MAVGARLAELLRFLAGALALSGLVAGIPVLYELRAEGHLGHGLRHLALVSGLETYYRTLAVVAPSVLGLLGLGWIVRRRPGGARRAAARRVSHPARSTAIPIAAALSLLTIGAELARRRAPGHLHARPNLLLLTVDTLRVDHLGCYGHGRPTSPNLDRLAAGGIRFEHAIAQASWTLPSMASLHTSLAPSQHGATKPQLRMARRTVTLAEVLRNAGYRTLAVVSHTFTSSVYGFAQGFERLDETSIGDHAASSSEDLTRSALRHLAEIGEEPVFLWVHYFDPHFTYVRHPDYRFASPRSRQRYTLGHLEQRQRELRRAGIDPLPDDPMMQEVRAVYDEEVAHTDHWIGRLLEGVAELGLAAPTITAVTADHGELFFEGGRISHGRDLDEALVHVPLILGGELPPELRGRTVPRTVAVSSLAKTLTRLARIAEDPFAGEDLLRVARAASPPPAPVFSEGNDAWSDEDPKLSVHFAGWKLVRHLETGEHRLYDLSAAAEALDLWPSAEPEPSSMRSRLLDELDRFQAAAEEAPATAATLSEAQRERLRTLGYLE